MLLARLVHTLSEEEIAEVRRRFSLPERSRLLFERIVSSPSSPPDSKQLAKIFRITKENLYRLFSEIVDECVRILAPKEEFATITFYGNKYLDRLFVTEILRTEKKLIKENDKRTLERFYAHAFTKMRAFPADLVNTKLFDTLGKKWLRFKANPQIDDDLHIQMIGMVIRLAALQAQKKMNREQMSEAAKKLMAPVTNRVLSSPNPLVHYEYYRARWVASVFENINPKESHSWLEKAMDLIRQYPNMFDESMKKFIELLIAYNLAMIFQHPKEGLEIFQKYRATHKLESVRDILYFIHFVKVAFLADDFDTAKSILSEFEGYRIVQTTPAIAGNALILRTMLEIFEEHYSLARKTLERAKNANKENYFLSSEIQVRALETAIAVNCGEFALADQNAERNVKWLRSRRINLSNDPWIYFHKMVAEIVRHKLTNEPFNLTIVENFRNDFRSDYPDFYLLLAREIPSS